MTCGSPRWVLAAVLPALVAVGVPAATAGQGLTPTERGRAVARYRDGQDALRDGRLAIAERAFREAIARDPSLELGYCGLGQVFMATRRYTSAVTAYRACRDTFQANAADAFADDLRRDQSLESRIDLLEQTRGEREMRSGEAPQSLALDDQIGQLERLRHRAPGPLPLTPAWISLGLGSAYLRTGRMEDAEREYRAALRSEPTLGEAHNNLAIVLMVAGRYEEAVRELDAAGSSGFRANPELRRQLEAAIGTDRPTVR